MGSFDAITFNVGRILVAPRPPDLATLQTQIPLRIQENLPLILVGILGEMILEGTNTGFSKYATAIKKYGFGSLGGSILSELIKNSHNPRVGSIGSQSLMTGSPIGNYGY